MACGGLIAVVFLFFFYLWRLSVKSTLMSWWWAINHQRVKRRRRIKKWQAGPVVMLTTAPTRPATHSAPLVTDLCSESCKSDAPRLNIIPLSMSKSFFISIEWSEKEKCLYLADYMPPRSASAPCSGLGLLCLRWQSARGSNPWEESGSIDK